MYFFKYITFFILPLNAIFLMANSSEATPIDVGSGYYSNYKTSSPETAFNKDWYVDFSNDVEVKILLSGSGTLEVSSLYLNPNTSVKLYLDDGTFLHEIKNNCELTYFCKIFYIDSTKINLSNPIAIRISAQKNNDDYKSFFVNYYENYISPDPYYEIPAYNTSAKYLIEALRDKLIGNLSNSDKLVKKRINTSAVLFDFLSTVCFFVSSKPVPGDGDDGAVKYIIHIPQSKKELFSEAAKEVIQKMGFYATDKLISNDEYESAFNHIASGLLAGTELGKGNLFPAIFEISSAFTETGIYGVGLYDLFGKDEIIAAHLVAEELFRNFSYYYPGDNRLSDISDTSLKFVADEFVVPSLNSQQDCSFLNNTFFQCRYDDYNKEKFLEIYKQLRNALIHKIDVYKNSSNIHVDVDNDGIPNQEDNEPNIPYISPPSNKLPVAIISNLSQQYMVGDALSVDSSNSYDPDGEIITSETEWSLIHPDDTVSYYDSPSLNKTLNEEGSYTLRLTVSDGSDRRTVSASFDVYQDENDPGNFFIDDETFSVSGINISTACTLLILLC